MISGVIGCRVVRLWSGVSLWGFLLGDKGFLMTELNLGLVVPLVFEKSAER